MVGLPHWAQLSRRSNCFKRRVRTWNGGCDRGRGWVGGDLISFAYIFARTYSTAWSKS